MLTEEKIKELRIQLRKICDMDNPCYWCGEEAGYYRGRPRTFCTRFCRTNYEKSKSKKRGGWTIPSLHHKRSVLQTLARLGDEEAQQILYDEEGMIAIYNEDLAGMVIFNIEPKREVSLGQRRLCAL